jgi:hypothetical protein
LYPCSYNVEPSKLLGKIDFGIFKFLILFYGINSLFLSKTNFAFMQKKINFVSLVNLNIRFEAFESVVLKFIVQLLYIQLTINKNQLYKLVFVTAKLSVHLDIHISKHG